MAYRYGRNGVFPAVHWEGEDVVGSDGIFPIGVGESVPGPVLVGNYISEILIGNTVIWSSTDTTTEQILDFDVSDYIGTYQLKFRIRRKD